MKKIRVFQAFKTTNPAPRRQSAGVKRRIVPGFFPKNLGTILLFLLMLPYLITFLFGNVKEGGFGTAGPGRGEGSYEGAYFVDNLTALGNETIPLEIYVADQLTRSVEEEDELEAAKAQAVLIRSGLMTGVSSSGENAGGREIKAADEEYGSRALSELALDAVLQTKGVCLMYQDQPVNGAYFAVSNGATRNGEELSLSECPYLKSVVCSRDFLSEDYVSIVSLKEGEFHRIWQQIPSAGDRERENLKNEAEKELGDISIWRDSAGYVLYVERDSKLVSGERFRESFHLASSSFHLSEEEGEIMITVKGAGHGLGMSRFSANEMAREGKDYTEILHYFFQDVTFTKFE